MFAIPFAKLSGFLHSILSRTEAEAKLEASLAELSGKAKHVDRLEERLRAAREERRKLELEHDQKLATVQQKMRADAIERATALKQTRNQLDSVINESKETESSENQRIRHELDRKKKALEIVFDKMKKQREIQHALKQRLANAENNEKQLNDAVRVMEEDYSNQINELKNALQEKVEIISKLNSELDQAMEFPTSSLRYIFLRKPISDQTS